MKRVDQVTPPWEESFDVLLRRAQAEFREMPGLRLTPAQATRLWGLEHKMCTEVIQTLVADDYLRWTASGSVTRA